MRIQGFNGSPQALTLVCEFPGGLGTPGCWKITAFTIAHSITLALATLAGRLQRRSLVVVFSDFTDPTSAQLMIESIGRLTKRHLVLFVTMSDEELQQIAADEPDRVRLIDASGEPDTVTARLLTALEDLLP